MNKTFNRVGFMLVVSVVFGGCGYMLQYLFMIESKAVFAVYGFIMGGLYCTIEDRFIRNGVFHDKNN